MYTNYMLQSINKNIINIRKNKVHVLLTVKVKKFNSIKYREGRGYFGIFVRSSSVTLASINLQTKT